MFYHSASLRACIRVRYEERHPEAADDVVAKLAEWLPGGYTLDEAEFARQLEEDAAFVPIGEKVHEYGRADRIFEVYHCDTGAPGLVEYHNRFQTFLIWYIEAGSFLDLTDDKWRILYLLERVDGPTGPAYRSAGMLTIYHWFAYPEHVRPRISQVLVLPPFQRQGHGADMLQQAYAQCRLESKLKDIAVEDPSDGFTRLRDFVDATNGAAAFSPDFFSQPFSDEASEKIRAALFVSKRQARRVFEILKLRFLAPGDAAGAERYRLEVKQRLFQPYVQRKALKELAPEEQEHWEKQRKASRDELQPEFERLSEEYMQIIARLEGQ